MHCLALVTDAFGGHGGVAQYNRDFLAALAESGTFCSITVLPRHALEWVAAPAGVTQMPPRRRKVAYSAMGVLTAFCRRADVVFCGHLYMSPLAWLIARINRAKLIIQMHGIEAWPRPPRLQRVAVEAADLVLCVSRHTRAAVAGWAAIAPERILVVPDTVADAFTPGDASGSRKALGFDGKKVLLTVGRLHGHERYKGHDRIIAALPQLVAQNHDIVYVVVGDGDDRPRLEGLARKAGVAEHVRFLGVISRQCLTEAYRMADLFAMPSTGEGFGITYLEAMASGTPALGLNVGGARDALADGELGTVVSEEDDLAAAIARLLATPKLDAVDLSRAVCTRFGPAAFRARVGLAFNRLV
jgi:phosphatidylinositol alpha-1,6-mannosyltransferase